MKKYRIFIILAVVIILLTGCTKNLESPNIDTEIKKEVLNMNNVVLNINNVEYKLNLENNDTVKDLLKNLPLSLSMTELNGNEYYAYLDFNLKTNSENVKTIKTGDVMLFGNNCIVVFYESFNTSYSYTKIGHIDNIDNLKDNLKSGNVELKVK